MEIPENGCKAMRTAPPPNTESRSPGAAALAQVLCVDGVQLRFRRVIRLSTFQNRTSSPIVMT